MLFRVVDIETVPDLSVWTPGKAQYELAPGQEIGFLHKALVGEKEAFPPPQAHRVVAIAWCDVQLKIGNSKTYELSSCHSKAAWSTEPKVDESLLVGAFGLAQEKYPATAVTWNGRTFDLPVLAMRAMKLGIPWGWYYKDKFGARYRYGEDGHCDLMDFLSDFGGARQMKLGDVARLIGLPGKTDMDGSKVADVVAQGPSVANEIKIARYCLQDAIQTAILFVRSRHHTGKISGAEYAASLKTFEESADIKSAIDIDWKGLAL
jgi:predicted PolB exonuclease-like 3'-5' exonuclease